MPLTARQKLLIVSQLPGCASAKDHMCSAQEATLEPMEVIRGKTVEEDVLIGATRVIDDN